VDCLISYSFLDLCTQIYGYTTDTSTYQNNQVNLQAAIPASQAGSDDASGTLRIHKDDFKMYNVNVKNTFGPGSQAIAISQYGSRVGLYACGFYGYQDTLYANQGTQVYLRGYIEVFFLLYFLSSTKLSRTWP
jgi:pectinesterase